MHIGSVAELWVYPVKSMRGQRVPSVALDAEGVRGDRRFAFTSSNAPAGKPLLSSRERAAMLLYTPEVSAQHVRTPGGLPVWLGEAALHADMRETSANKLAEFQLLHSPERPLTDVRPVSLVSTATLNALSEEMREYIDPQRFRSNILLKLDSGEPFAENAWSTCTLRLGEGDEAAELLIRERIPRCRMVSLDPQTAEPNHTVLKHLARHHEGRLGIYATVFKPGMLRENQAVFLF